ncbi:MAG: VOC family protein [Acidobacteria bacterium]|nr:VOC family protein [Acidobacteriota bacterium]
MTSSGEIGRIGWIDLTVPDADSVPDFYRSVVGWNSTDVDMGGYNDCSVHAGPGEAPVAGICHARGSNAALPPQWVVYITVADLDESLRKCVELGGQIVHGPAACGGQGRFRVFRDPAGAIAALYQPVRKGS